MTFSLVARCPESGMFGMAISSSSPAVAARCAHARAGVGAVASQNLTDPALGILGLDLLAGGDSADTVLEKMVRAAGENAQHRQFVLVDRGGLACTFSGAKALGLFAEASAPGVAAAGNLLMNEAVPRAMVAGFEAASGILPDRLMAGLAAGLAAGGEAGEVHSAGLLVVDRLTWPIVDLRVDWAESDPIGALADLWRLYKPQMADYVRRALSPDMAPSFGVAGDP